MLGSKQHALYEVCYAPVLCVNGSAAATAAAVVATTTAVVDM